MKFVFLFLFPLLCHAAPITFTFEGQVSSITMRDCLILSPRGGCSSFVDIYGLGTSDFFDGKRISIGDHVRGSFTYDTDKFTLIIDQNGTRGNYMDTETSSTFNGGDISLSSKDYWWESDGYVVENNRYVGIMIDAFLLSMSYRSPEWYIFQSIFLQDSSATVFSDLSPPTELDLNDFSTIYSTIVVGMFNTVSRDYIQVRSTITSLSFDSIDVPEPTPAFLFVAGLLACWTKGRKHAAIWQRHANSAN